MNSFKNLRFANMLLLKLNRCFRYCLFIALVTIFTQGNVSAQVVLGASPYTQNFNFIGGGLPVGWSVRWGATASGVGCLGTAQSFVNAPTPWNNTTGNYRNSASANVGTSFDNTATQGAQTDRAPSVKNSSGFIEGQGAFALQLANTTGKYGFQISFKAQLLDVQGRTNTFLVDYGYGASPTSFTQAAIPFTFTDLGINSGNWGQTTINVNFGNALDNNAGNIYIRIANLVLSTGSGSRCTFGIDDVSLTWSTVAPTVALTSPNPAVATGTVAAGSTNKVLYEADVTVVNSTTSLTALNLTTAGTYAATDLTNLKLWYQSTSTFNSAIATLITTNTTGLGAGLQSFTGMNQAYPVGTGYLFVTADMACTASPGNTININTPLATDFSFGATVPTGTLFVGGAQTITGITPSNVTGLVCTPGNGEIDFAWTNPVCYDEIMIVATDDAGGVTSVPTGDGTQYTQNTIYNDGTNFVNLNPNEFCIYKGSTSPVTMINLINGAAYYIKVFTRLGTQWSSGVTCSTIPVPASNGDFRSIATGNWNNYLIWEKFVVGPGWGPAPAGEFPNSQMSAVTIQAGTTVSLNVDGISVKTLTVNATGKLFCNGYAFNRYLSVFGTSITCNGIIGNAPLQDVISFNIEGNATPCVISGTGTFDCNRIRKNFGTNLTTNLTINMNVTTWWTGTAIYNAYNGDPNAFNVTIAAGKTVNCSNGGSYAIDGQTGTTPGSSYGTTTVNGTLTVSSTLYLTCFNPAPYNCKVAITGTGLINAATVNMNSTSGGAQHFFSIASGGKLNITGTIGISPFSTTSNNYTLATGSTVEYSATGDEPVESGLSYSNLTISGSGIKTCNGNVSVGKTFLLTSGSYSQNVAANYYTTTIAANGTLTGNGGNFAGGDAGGTVSFAGAGTINGTTALGFDVLKINAGTVTNSINNSTCDTLNLTGGTFVIGNGLTFGMLTNGVLTSSGGNFIAGNAGGTVNFAGNGKITGTTAIGFDILKINAGTVTNEVTNATCDTLNLTGGIFSIGSGLTFNMLANGVVTSTGGNFSAGNAGGILSFAGNGIINGTTAIGFDILKINAGTVTNAVTNATCDTLDLTGGIFTIGTALTFNMLNNGVVTATAGNFATGATGGILNFQGPAGKFIGNSSPYDVYTSGGVDFGAGTVTIQGGGSLRINANGYVNTNGCFYANNSSLVYNNGSTFNAGAEWYAFFASGRGVPYNVQIGTSAVSNTKVDFQTSNAWRQMNGNLYIGPAAGGAGYGLILSTVSGGDIIVGGNWTRTAATATFTPNTRAVTFNGASSSTVSVLAGGMETFAYLIINKSAGVAVIQAAAPNATNITVNGNGGSNILQMISGDLDLNQQTFNFTTYFNGNSNNLGIDGTAGNLTRNINSTGGTGIFAVLNSDPVTHNITINRMSGNAALLVLGTNVTMTTAGVGAGGGGINFGNTLTTVNGTLQINSYGFVTGFAPTYGTNSFLVYNSGGLFDRNVEWGALSGPGYPYHVVVQNGTNIRLNTPAGNGNADRAIAGNLSIVAGSSLLLSTTASNTLTVGKNVVLDGTLTLPTAPGGDLHIGENWNRSISGVFTPNDRAVYFEGTNPSTITANAGQLFPYLYLAKNALATTLTLMSNIYISKEFGITSGTFDLAADSATLKSDVTGTADFGKVGATGDVAYSGAGRFIVERYIPTGVGGGLHAKTWQFLAVPDNGGQTINAGWQEGNVLPTIGAAGLGTIISNNVAGAGFDIIAGVGPSIKTFVPATATWVGVPNTTPTPLFNKQGYFLFVRGDRNVSAYNIPATNTTLRTMGKLFVPTSNPPVPTTVLPGKFETIGNPYASAIDFLLVSRPSGPALDSVFYVWDPLLYGYWGYGGYQTISSSNAYKPNPGGTANYSSALAYTKIQSGQAFFVHATGAGGVISFTENAKLSGSNLVYRSPADYSNNNRQYFRAQLYSSAGNMADANVVAFSNTFSNAYDANDALKILNAGENFGISSNEQLLAIEARKPVVKSDTVQYALNNLSATTAYQFRFGPENMDNNIKAWLVDKYLGTHLPVNLTDSSFFDFTITADPASSAADRFMVVFKRKKGPLNHFEFEDPADSIEEESEVTKANIKAGPNTLAGSAAAEISVYPNPVVNSVLQVNFSNKPAGNYQLQLLNSSGQIVYEQRIAVKGNYFAKSLHITTVAAGYYNLVVTGEDGSKKVEGIVVE